MTDEVRDMIGRALDGEPPIGIAYETVLGAGKRRRARRNLGIVGGAVLGVVAVASVAVTVDQLSSASPPNEPAATVEPAAPGCVVPPGTRGSTHNPDGVASAAELAESARLTEAFGRFDFRLPAGVTMDPIKPKLCVIDDSWGTSFTLRTADSAVVISLEVSPRGGDPAGDCTAPNGLMTCSLINFDQTATRVVVNAPTPQADGRAPLAGVPTMMAAWRGDDTIVRVVETDADKTKPGCAILPVQDLARIATAPELGVDWPKEPRVTPAEPSGSRADQLTTALAQLQPLPRNTLPRKVPHAVAPNAMGFYVSQGGYKLDADLTDSAGEGNLFINLNPPTVGMTKVDCSGQVSCRMAVLSDGRSAVTVRQIDGKVIRLTVTTLAADGTQVMIACVNRSAKAESVRNVGVTRPDPPLMMSDLLRIAALPDLKW